MFKYIFKITFPFFFCLHFCIIVQRSLVFGVTAASLSPSLLIFRFSTARSLQDVAAAAVVAMLPTF